MAKARGRELKGSMVELVVGVDKRTVWGLFAKFHESYILIQTGHVIHLRVGISTSRGWQEARAFLRAG